MSPSDETISLLSPAKVNLFLRILGRRPDGYHELASLFQTIALCDTLHFNMSDVDLLTSTNLTLPTGPSNLIWKAIKIFREKTGIFFPVKVLLEKRIPLEAGLGGGSSNAATALWAMNRLAGMPATSTDLMKWSAEIGSDVPFFFSSGTAYCTGRGEKIASLNPLPNQKISIFKPLQGLSTPAVYQRLKVENLERRDPEAFLKRFVDNDPYYFNDLEVPAFELLTSLQQFKRSLERLGFDHVLLSGSGSAFFCIGEPVKNSPLSLVDAQFEYSAEFINRVDNDWY